MIPVVRRQLLLRSSIRALAGCALVALAVSLSSCSSSDMSVNGPSATKCQVSVAGSPPSVPAGGGSGTLAVTTTRDCTWTASSATAWLTLSGSTNGQGSGEVAFTATPNVDPSVRRATVAVNDTQVVVAQDAAVCRFTVTPPSASIGASGGTVSVRVETASAACTWSTSSQTAWIHVSGASQSGTGTVSITVDANSGPARSGTAVVAGQTIRVDQDAVPSTPVPPPGPGPEPTPPAPPPGPGACTFGVEPMQVSAPALGLTSSLAVTTSAACAWTTAVSDASWIIIQGTGVGTGSGTVPFAIAPSLLLLPRTGTITVGNQTVAVTQAPLVSLCTFSISPTSATVGAADATLSVMVTTQAGCAWREEQVDPWLELGSVSSGTGSGTAQVGVQRYKGNGTRTGTMTIAGQTFSVTQNKSGE